MARFDSPRATSSLGPPRARGGQASALSSQRRAADGRGPHLEPSNVRDGPAPAIQRERRRSCRRALSPQLRARARRGRRSARRPPRQAPAAVGSPDRRAAAAARSEPQAAATRSPSLLVRRRTVRSAGPGQKRRRRALDGEPVAANWCCSPSAASFAKSARRRRVVPPLSASPPSRAWPAAPSQAGFRTRSKTAGSSRVFARELLPLKMAAGDVRRCLQPDDEHVRFAQRRFGEAAASSSRPCTTGCRPSRLARTPQLARNRTRGRSPAPRPPRVRRPSVRRSRSTCSQ